MTKVYSNVMRKKCKIGSKFKVIRLQEDVNFYMRVGHSKWSVRKVLRFWVSMRKVSPGNFCSKALMILEFLEFYTILAFAVKIYACFSHF